MKTVLVYGLGALLAILVNLGVQELALGLFQALTWNVVASVLAGTAVGLVFKYVWDKVLIFDYRAGTAARDAQTFLAYALTGVVTTAIFWGFEFGFDAVFGTKLMRYVGAVIGLTIGYVLKYRLDRRYVFGVGQPR